MTDLSLIVPIHNETRRLPLLMDRIFRVQDTAPCSLQVYLVDNGSTDQTGEIAACYARMDPDLVKCACLPMRGKGAAVRYGMLDANGEWRMMVDCDLAVSLDQIFTMYTYAKRRRADVVVGSREIPGAVRLEPLHRRIMSRVYLRLVQACALPGISDSQCGFKLFSARAAVELCSLQTLAGMSFDVELLYLARRLGYTIHEHPVLWVNDDESRVRLIRDSVSMFRDVLQIHRNDRAGIYNADPSQTVQDFLSSPVYRSP